MPAEAYERSANERPSPKSGRDGMVIVGAAPSPPPRGVASDGVASPSGSPSGGPTEEWLDGLGLRAAHEMLEQQRQWG